MNILRCRIYPLVLLMALLLLCLAISRPSYAEQKITYGEYDVHYIVLPTLSLNQEIANKYDLPRGKNKALVNISVLRNNDASSTGQIDAATVKVSGRSENLLGQRQKLTFTEITEGPAIYYLALLRHADEEFHRVSIDILLPNGHVAELRFQQKMYWEN